MASRRQFLAGLIASGLTPTASWATVGAPAYLAAAARQDGAYVLCGLSPDCDIIFEIPLPARGHAAAAHPTRPEAVAFARRPGTYAIVLDCRDGDIAVRLNAPAGRHFYGHGTFSRDGARLYTTENDYEAGVGVIGVWDVETSYKRLGEFSSGGVGPHDLRRLPGTETLVVANGGIDTHPESGRAKLNIATMQPNLAYLMDGQGGEVATLPPEMHKNSIRHLAVANDGQVALGMQWQGDGDSPPLVGLHRRGADIQLLDAPSTREMDGYIGSVAFTGGHRSIVVTSPRGGRVQRFDAASARFDADWAIKDACGAATAHSGALITTGEGILTYLSESKDRSKHVPRLQWDNHLVSLTKTD